MLCNVFATIPSFLTLRCVSYNRIVAKIVAFVSAVFSPHDSCTSRFGRLHRIRTRSRETANESKRWHSSMIYFYDEPKCETPLPRLWSPSRTSGSTRSPAKTRKSGVSGRSMFQRERDLISSDFRSSSSNRPWLTTFPSLLSESETVSSGFWRHSSPTRSSPVLQFRHYLPGSRVVELRIRSPADLWSHQFLRPRKFGPFSDGSVSV